MVKARKGRAIGAIVAFVVAAAGVLTGTPGSPAFEAAVTDGTLTPWAYLPLITRHEPPVYVLPNYSDYYSGSRSLQVVGEVYNSTEEPLCWVEVAADFLDSSGQVVAVEYDYADLRPLLPGEKTCFCIWAWLSSGEWASYQFEPISYYACDWEPVDLTIVSHDTRYSSWAYVVHGFVRNDDTRRVDYPGVISTLYNASGTVVGCGYGAIGGGYLDPGQTGSFEAYHFYDGHFPDIASYRLQTGRIFE